MSAKLVKFDKKEQDDSKLIELFEKCLSRAKNGEFHGAIVILENSVDSFEYYRVNIDLITAIGLYNRGLYRANHEWDEL